MGGLAVSDVHVFAFSIRHVNPAKKQYVCRAMNPREPPLAPVPHPFSRPVSRPVSSPVHRTGIRRSNQTH
jgi:hypothetical protein